MSNKITESYFEHTNFGKQEKRVLAEIIAKTNFQPEKEIFRGQIYDKDKVASLIYKGLWQDKPAVLKIQGLKPEVDEIDMINKFNHQNESKIIRLPKLYAGTNWNEQDGYCYSLLEYVEAPQIYQTPFANQEQIQEFCQFYQEYKTQCLKKPLFKKEPNELSSLVYTVQRVSNWAKIAQSKGALTEKKVKIMERFFTLAGQHLPSLQMEFMHGHLSNNDIFKINDHEYVLMSNLFWCYRPEYYDTTFHLWAGIKSLRDQKVNIEEIKQYLQTWLEEYKKLSIIAKDPNFERKFQITMAERCIGALLVDITNQTYQEDQTNYINHLTDLFSDLFNYLAEKLDQ